MQKGMYMLVKKPESGRGLHEAVGPARHPEALRRIGADVVAVRGHRGLLLRTSLRSPGRWAGS